MRESVIQGNILKALRDAGGWWVKYHAGPRYSTAGVPDIIGCYRGIFVGLEVKRPGQKPTKLQARTLEKIRHDGRGVSAVVHSVDEAMAIINAIQRRIKN